MSYRWLLAPLLVAAAVLAGCGDDGPASPPGDEPDPRLQQVTSNEFYEANPVISPDAAWIVYELGSAGNRDIWRLRLTDGLHEQLTTSPAFRAATVTAV